MHLAAGQGHVRQRNSDVASILEGNAILPLTVAFGEPLAYVGGGDGSFVLDHELVFVSGIESIVKAQRTYQATFVNNR